MARIKPIKKWEIQGLDGWLTISETKEGDQVVVAVSRFDGTQVQTVRLGKEEWDGLHELGWEVRVVETKKEVETKESEVKEDAKVIS